MTIEQLFEETITELKVLFRKVFQKIFFPPEATSLFLKNIEFWLHSNPFPINGYDAPLLYSSLHRDAILHPEKYTDGASTPEHLEFYVKWLNTNFKSLIEGVLRVWLYDVKCHHKKDWLERLQTQKHLFIKARHEIQVKGTDPHLADLINLLIEAIDVFIADNQPRERISVFTSFHLNEKDYSVNHVKDLYTACLEQRLIDQKTTKENFVAVFTGQDIQQIKPVRWLLCKTALVYFVGTLGERKFYTENVGKWEKTKQCFEAEGMRTTSTKNLAKIWNKLKYRDKRFKKPNYSVYRILSVEKETQVDLAIEKVLGVK
jgi:hypothetical protein